MAQPTFAQYRSPSNTSSSLQLETLWERVLTCLCVMGSGQNPDGTARNLS